MRAKFNSAAAAYMSWAEDMKRRVAFSDEETGDQDEELQLIKAPDKLRHIEVDFSTVRASMSFRVFGRHLL